jgi:hypothetical protein
LSPPVKLKIAEALAFFLTEKARLKGAFGGRGGGKSWAVADALIMLAIQSPVRILCTRELQNSIKDSVHRLLRDRIDAYGLSGLFEITENEIRGRNGSLFVFKGLRSNITEIKSLEGIKYCWIEEAQRVSQESLDVLIPTIRSPESEIWATWNTGTEHDPIYQMLVKNTRQDAIVRKVNYDQNPWFPKELLAEAEYDRLTDDSKYRHVWLGEPLIGGVFFDTFGPHLMIRPRMLGDEIEGRLVGALDHGITHPTVFQLALINPQPKAFERQVELLFTYSANGATAAAHAREIEERIRSFVSTGGRFPDVVVADPSMFTKNKMNEHNSRAFIDEYIDLFRDTGRRTQFVPATNNKLSRDGIAGGCGIMREMFAKQPDGTHRFGFWDIYNQSFVDGIKRVVADENHPEIYAKMDGDDEADCSRYCLSRCWDMIHNQFKSNKKPEQQRGNLLFDAARYSRKLAGEACCV